MHSAERPYQMGSSYCTVQYCTDVCVRTVLASLELGSPLIDVCDVCMFVRHR